MGLRKVAALSFCAVTVAACGGRSSSIGETAHVVAAWQTYSAALSSGNGAAACAAMTPGLVRQLLTAITANSQTRALAGPSCSQLLDLAIHAQKNNPQVREAFAAVGRGTVTDLRIHGNSASFTVAISVSGRSVKIPGQAQEQNGTWRISCCLGSGPPG